MSAAPEQGGVDGLPEGLAPGRFARFVLRLGAPRAAFLTTLLTMSTGVGFSWIALALLNRPPIAYAIATGVGLAVSLAVTPLVSYVAFRLMQDRADAVDALEKALSEVRTLRGLLPICAGCKNIRDDAGEWQRIESYVANRTDAKFSHGLCPTCAKRLYPDLAPDEK